MAAIRTCILRAGKALGRNDRQQLLRSVDEGLSEIQAVQQLIDAANVEVRRLEEIEIEDIASQKASKAAGAAISQSATEPRPKTELTAEPVSAGPAEEIAPTREQPSQIEDFGEKIGGARKDLWGGFLDKLGADLPPAAQIVMSKHFPAPNYEKLAADGVTAKDLALVKAMRDVIPNKPRRSWQLNSWAQQLETIRDFAKDIIEGRFTADFVADKLVQTGERGLVDLKNVMDLYLAAGFPANKANLKGVRIRSGSYSQLRGQHFDPAKTFWTIERKSKGSAFGNWPRVLGEYYESREALMKAAPGIFEAMAGKEGGQTALGKTKLDIYRETRTGKIWIGKKVAANKYIDLKEFPKGRDGSRAAREYLNENLDDLLALLEKKKHIPPVRRSTNDPRIGLDHRNGEDVTPELFQDTFGFRGVEFGNWVEQGKRQADLNNAYDGLLDLAGILNVPPKALALNGRLGLAFGARGKGGVTAAAAHFESGKDVINLTKKSGAGSLAHEWWHALDNYFGKQRSKGAPLFLTENAALRRVRGETGEFVDETGVRPEVMAAYKSLTDAIEGSEMFKRSTELDKRRTKRYWDTRIEMTARAFERYVIDKAGAKGERSDYLANIVPEAAFDDVYPYPTNAEAKEFEKSYDQIFSTLKTKETDTGVELFSLKPDVVEKADAIEADLRKRMKTVGISDKISLKLLDVIFDKEGAYVMGAKGRFANRTIEIALSTKNKQWTLDHEIIHAFRDLGVIRPAEWKTLERAALADEAGMQSVRDRYVELELSDEKLMEEAVANMHANWAAGKLKAKGFIRTAFERIRAFFEALGNAFRDNGFQSASDVFERIGRGEIGGRSEIGTAEQNEYFQRAFHGSPHLFDQFLTDKIGTGEGAQAFGYGLYFAENAGVAQSYQSSLGRDDFVKRFLAELPEDAYFNEVMDLIGSEQFTPAQETLLRELEKEDWLGFDYPSQAINAALNKKALSRFDTSPELRLAAENAGIGKLYEVEIKDEAVAQMLDWDALIKDQPENVQKFINLLDDEVVTAWKTNGTWERLTGGNIYQHISGGMTRGNVDGQKAASGTLNDASIPGIKYFDAGSRAGTAAGGGFIKPLADAIKGKDTRTRNLVVFDDSVITIKSVDGKPVSPEAFALGPDGKPAVSRFGQFDPERAARFTAPPNKTPAGPVPNQPPLFEDGFSSVDESLADYVRYKLQDRYIDLRRLQESVEPIPDEMNAYVAEELYHGKAEVEIEEAREQSMKPLLDAIKAAELSVDEAGEYLYARHAKERNKRIAEINPKFEKGGGSGMTDAEANEIMAQYVGNKEIGKVSELVDAITKKHRNLLVSSGLETAETIAAWEGLYENYVPLKGLPGEQQTRPSPGRGRGFDVRGRTKRALGRKSRAQNIISSLLTQYETDIIRAQKAEVGRALLNFVEAHPDQNIWEVDKVEYAGSVDSNTGLVVYRPNKRYQLADNVLVVKVGGVDRHITFHGNRGQRIASAMKNMGAANAGTAIRAFASVNRMLAMVNTSLNPEFIVSNLLRDVQTAGINLAGTEADAMKVRIIKDIGSAWRGIRRAQKKKGGEWAEHYERFRKAGGKTGWIDAHNDVERLHERLERELKRQEQGKGGAAMLVRRLGEFIEAENTAVENAVRLSAFVHATKMGMSETKAASLAKNLTVNFNRRGEYGMLMNSLYLFYNASVQGNIRMLQALKSPKVRKIVGGIVVFATMLDILNRILGGDDDDGIPRYDKIPPWVKERNLIIMSPWSEEGYFKIPLPWGYNIFHVLGQQIGTASSAAMGLQPDYKPIDSAVSLLSATLGAFNPLGSEATLSQFLSPTVTDPIVSLGENLDWAGRPIRPAENPFETAPSPDSQKYWNSTGEIPRWITKKLNQLTGGSEVRPGTIDVSPTTLEFLYEFATGGAGRFLSNIVDAPLKLIVDGEVDTYHIPFVRKVYADIGTRATQDRFYKNLEQVYYAEQEMKLAIETKDTATRRKLQDEYGAYLSSRLIAKETERRLRVLRAQRNDIKARQMSERQKRRRLRRIEDKMQREMLNFNRRVRTFQERQQ